MKAYFGLITLFIYIALVPAGALARMGLSPLRHGSESYEQARVRSSSASGLWSQANFRNSAESSKKPLFSLDLKSVPEVSSMEQLKSQFEYVRDTRFLNDSSLKFPRRISWLFPDDGCYVRAELAGVYLKERGFLTPKKVFAFGKLMVETVNSPYGAVGWWYHVAVAYRVGETVYIYDPAIQPKEALTLEQWDSSMGGASKNIEYSICDANTFDPYSDCVKPRMEKKSSVESEQLSFLSDEWTRIESLGRDPIQELGNNPPWL